MLSLRWEGEYEVRDTQEKESVFSILGDLFQFRCEVKGQGCRMCTDCKGLWGEFVIFNFGLYKIKWIDLSRNFSHEALTEDMLLKNNALNPLYCTFKEAVCRIWAFIVQNKFYYL